MNSIGTEKLEYSVNKKMDKKLNIIMSQHIQFPVGEYLLCYTCNYNNALCNKNKNKNKNTLLST